MAFCDRVILDKTEMPVPKVVYFVQDFQGQKMVMICSCYELERIHKLSARICSKPLRLLIPKEMKETQVRH